MKSKEYLGPDFLAILFAENKEAVAAEFARVPTAAEAAKATRDAGPKSRQEVYWDVYGARSPRSLALALLLD